MDVREGRLSRRPPKQRVAWTCPPQADLPASGGKRQGRGVPLSLKTMR